MHPRRNGPRIRPMADAAVDQTRDSQRADIGTWAMATLSGYAKMPNVS
jgi:hypothetical protein